MTGVASSETTQDQLNIDTIVRQFHTNYANGAVEKKGAPVDDNLVHLGRRRQEHPAGGAALDGRAGGRELIEVEGASHALTISQTDAVAGAILRAANAA